MRWLAVPAPHAGDSCAQEPASPRWWRPAYCATPRNVAVAVCIQKDATTAAFCEPKDPCLWVRTSSRHFDVHGDAVAVLVLEPGSDLQCACIQLLYVVRVGLGDEAAHGNRAWWSSCWEFATRGALTCKQAEVMQDCLTQHPHVARTMHRTQAATALQGHSWCDTYSSSTLLSSPRLLNALPTSSAGAQPA